MEFDLSLFLPVLSMSQLLKINLHVKGVLLQIEHFKDIIPSKLLDCYLEFMNAYLLVLLENYPQARE